MKHLLKNSSKGRTIFNLPTVSVIVATRDRSKDLADLLLTVLDQSYLPLEVIIVDDSLVASVRKVVDSLNSRFESHNSQLKYIKGSGDGLPAARNLGVKNSGGEAVLFLDDDTLLDPNVVSSLSTFLRDNPAAIGVQPEILSPAGDDALDPAKMFENAIYRVFLLTYREKNKLAVRRSGASVFPSLLTRVISAQRLSGSCSCYKREVFNDLSFDTNLKRWGFAEDLDFSHRVYKMHPQSLYAVPYSKLIHKASENARLPTKLRVNMTTIYWSYVFFKDIYECSTLNLMAFLWAMSGNLAVTVGGLIVKKKPRIEWLALAYLIGSYATALRQLKNIRMARLDFFNKNL